MNLLNTQKIVREKEELQKLIEKFEVDLLSNILMDEDAKDGIRETFYYTLEEYNYIFSEMLKFRSWGYYFKN